MWNFQYSGLCPIWINALKFPNMQICKYEFCYLKLIILPSSMSYASVPQKHIDEANIKLICWVADGRGCGWMREAAPVKQWACCLHYGTKLFILVNKLVIAIQRWVFIEILNVLFYNCLSVFDSRYCLITEVALGQWDQAKGLTVNNHSTNVGEFLLVRDGLTAPRRTFRTTVSLLKEHLDILGKHAYWCHSHVR